MFNLTYLGHAGWLCESEEFKCVFDPWSSTAGAFFDSWYPFPNNSHLDFKKILSNLDFVYISHAHEDHLVPDTLKLVDKQTTILIPKFKDRTTFLKLKKIGFKNIQEVDEKQETKIKSVSIKISSTEGNIENDSCILLEREGVKLLNLNDCHIDFRRLKEFCSNQVDALLLQSSNAIWWPCNYEYEQEQKDFYGKVKRDNLLNRALKYCESVSPRFVVPNAGPPIFANENMKKWNFNRKEEWNPFCMPTEASEFFSKNKINSDYMVPGEVMFIDKHNIDINKNTSFRDAAYNGYDKYLNEYLREIKTKKKKQNKQDDIPTLFEKFKKQIKIISRISNIYVEKIDFNLLLEFSRQEKWIIDFRNKSNPIQEYKNQNFRYHFKMKKEYVAKIMKEDNWDFERLFLSGNFSCSRDPDIFNENVFIVLKYFDTKRFLSAEQIYAENHKMKDELFVLNHNGCQYEVQKYCPHMYADLEEIGYIDDEENFVCPLHGWKFNVNSGECPGKKEKLKIKRLN